MKYIFRLIGLPFLIVLYVLARTRDLFMFAYLHMRYGSEVLVYQDKFNPFTVRQALTEKLIKDETPKQP